MCGNILQRRMALRLHDECVFYEPSPQLVLSKEIAAETDSELSRAHFAAEILKLNPDVQNPERYRKYLLTLPAWQLRELAKDLKNDNPKPVVARRCMGRIYERI